MLRPGFEPGICDLKGHNAWPDYAIVILWYDYYTTGASRMMYKSQYNTLRPMELDIFRYKISKLYYQVNIFAFNLDWKRLIKKTLSHKVLL